MVAIPVKSDKENSTLVSLFGKAKFFSVMNEEGAVIVHTNSAHGGIEVAAWLKDLGVKRVVLNHVGETPFHALLKAGIDVYFGANKALSLHDVVTQLNQGMLEKVTVINYMKLLGDETHHHDESSHHHSKCSCAHA